VRIRRGGGRNAATNTVLFFVKCDGKIRSVPLKKPMHRYIPLKNPAI
jgi:hypothetical protein